MNDAFGILIPQVDHPLSVLMVDMYEMDEILETKLNNESDKLKISCLEKLSIIESIFPDSIVKNKLKNIASYPYFMNKNLSVDDAKVIAENVLNQICKTKLKILSYTYYSNRLLLNKKIGYKLIIYNTEPVEPDNIMVKNQFWLERDSLINSFKEFNYYIVGNELNTLYTMLPNVITSPNPIAKDLKITDNIESIIYDINLSQLIKDSICDHFTLNYIFLDFLINSYPSDAMSYPQFVGFAVARGIFIKQTKKIFKLFNKSTDKLYMDFKTFLLFVICMDISSVHSGEIKSAREKLIFNYFDIDKDKLLNESEFSCLVKRMFKKAGKHLPDDPKEAIMEFIQKLLNNEDEHELPLSLESFESVADYNDMSDIKYLLRFTKPYLEIAKCRMENYCTKSATAKTQKELDDYEYKLIPYFIEEAYNPEDIFDKMKEYSQNYSGIRKLIDKIDETNKSTLAITKFKYSLPILFNLIRYHLAEITFNMWHGEFSNFLRNPLFICLVATALALLFPSLFLGSSLFWRRILLFFIMDFPSLFGAYFQNRRNKLKDGSITDLNGSLELNDIIESIDQNKAQVGSEIIKQNHWMIKKQDDKSTINNEKEFSLYDIITGKNRLKQDDKSTINNEKEFSLYDIITGKNRLKQDDKSTINNEKEFSLYDTITGKNRLKQNDNEEQNGTIFISKSKCKQKNDKCDKIIDRDTTCKREYCGLIKLQKECHEKQKLEEKKKKCKKNITKRSNETTRKESPQVEITVSHDTQYPSKKTYNYTPKYEQEKHCKVCPKTMKKQLSPNSDNSIIGYAMSDESDDCKTSKIINNNKLKIN